MKNCRMLCIFSVFTTLFVTSVLHAQSCSENDKLFTLAKKSLDEFDLPKALKLAEKSVERCEYFDNLMLLGEIHYRSTDFDEALGVYESAEKIAPSYDDRARVFAKYGETLQKKGLVHEALTHYGLAYKQHSKPVPEWIAQPYRELEMATSEGTITSDQIRGGIGVMKMGLSLPRDRLSVKPSVNIRALYFEFDSVKLTSGSDEQLTELISALVKSQDDPKFRIRFIGHSDKRGDAQYNMELSYNRAQYVRELVVNKYPKLKSKIVVEGRGEMDLIDLGESERSHSLNRRLTLEAI